MTDKEFTEAQKTAIRETISRSAELMAMLYQLDEEQLDNVYTFIKALSEENNYDGRKNGRYTRRCARRGQGICSRVF